jgi:subtilisin family serine protease
VAAGTDDGTPLATSNRGSTSVDLVAPGSNLRSLDPAGRSVRVSGTSFAVPAAAAAAAALRNERPGATGAELALALRCGRRGGDGLVDPAATVGGFLDPELARVAIVTGRCPADD